MYAQCKVDVAEYVVKKFTVIFFVQDVRFCNNHNFFFKLHHSCYCDELMFFVCFFFQQNLSTIKNVSSQGHFTFQILVF